MLARVVNKAGPRAVVCGDVNVSRKSALFSEFMAATGLADAFESAGLVFAEKEPLGYVSDHIGLRARLFLTASTPGRGGFARP